LFQNDQPHAAHYTVEEDKATEVSRQQAELLLMAYVLRHSVSGEGLKDLLELFNVLAPHLQLSRSKFLFMKQFNDDMHFDMHFVCNFCGGSIDFEVSDVCPTCDKNVQSKKHLQKLGSFFVTVPLEPQLNRMLTKYHVDNFRPCIHAVNVMENTCCGKQTKNLKQGLNSLTLTINTDGVPISGSSRQDIWPILCSVSELNLKERSAGMILCGLWCGKTKPKINIFFKPFVEELQRLGTEGFVATFKDDVQANMKVFVGAVSVDTPARAMLQNLKQFNGRYGCAWCEMEGESVVRRRGHTRIYPERETPVVQRTHERFVDHASSATDDKSFQGVKGPSVLMLLPKFNIVDHFVVDYMHAALLGTTRQFVKLWFEGNDERFSLRRKRATIDSKIRCIRPPKEIRRLPRPLVDMKYWKASEWRSFLLFYSPVLLRGEFTNAKYYNHWMLMVSAVLLLLQKHIPKESIEKAHLCLMKFVILVPKLYGIEHVSYNVHLLTHIKNTVLNWGPLWGSSAFAFEDANGTIKELFHGTQAVPQQMVKNFLLLKHEENSAPVLQNAIQIAVDLFGKLTRSNVTPRSFHRAEDKLVLLGRPVTGLSMHNNLVLCEFMDKVVENCGETFHKFVYEDVLFASESYCEKFGRDDSYVMVFDEGHLTYGRITEICVVLANIPLGSNKQPYLFYKKLTVDDQHPITDQYVGFDLLSRHKLILHEANISSVCRISSLRRKCIRVGDSICALPKFELD
jgi:Protein of unknown function (DUF1258)